MVKLTLEDCKVTIIFPWYNGGRFLSYALYTKFDARVRVRLEARVKDYLWRS